MTYSIVFLDADSLGADCDLADLKNLGDVTLYPTTPLCEIVSRLEHATVVITNKVPLSANTLKQLPFLRLICVAATGVDHIDREAAARQGISVKNVSHYSTESVAQHTLALALNLLHHLPYYSNYVQSGHYCQSTLFTHLDRPFSQIKGKRWGIIGLGAIGKRTAELASAFGADIIYYSTSGKNLNACYRSTSLEELLRTSDIVSIHAPLNPQTNLLISTQQLRLMQPHALLLNLGRGGIVDEHALATALNEGWIAGAASDVFSKEPIPIDHPFLQLYYPERLIATPHIAWASKEARNTLVQSIAAHIRTFFEPIIDTIQEK